MKVRFLRVVNCADRLGYEWNYYMPEVVTKELVSAPTIM